MEISLIYAFRCLLPEIKSWELNEGDQCPILSVQQPEAIFKTVTFPIVAAVTRPRQIYQNLRNRSVPSATLSRPQQCGRQDASEPPVTIEMS